MTQWNPDMVNRIAQKGLIDYVVTTMAVDLVPVGGDPSEIFWIVFWALWPLRFCFSAYGDPLGVTIPFESLIHALPRPRECAVEPFSPLFRDDGRDTGFVTIDIATLAATKGPDNHNRSHQGMADEFLAPALLTLKATM